MTDVALNPVVQAELDALGRGDGVVEAARLSGGMVADTWLVTYEDGTRVVAKTLVDGPADIFEVEAAGLRALADTGRVRTPGVLAATGRVLVLEALGPPEDTPAYWEALAHHQAALHRNTVHDRFGWHRDGYLGRLVQRNGWKEDGHAFFSENRLLRYLDEPLVQAAFTRSDRRALQRLCDRLPDIVPAMAPVLTHGDLWSGNLLATANGLPVLADPAVCYTWAEVDLAMLWGCPRPAASDRFFDVYQELNPSPPGRQERFPVLFLREALSTVAHIPAAARSLETVRAVLQPFRTT